jgi:ribonuclease HI
MHLKNTNTSIELYTDSNYLRQGITEWIYNWKKNNWRTSSKKPVANRELWIELDTLNSQMNVNWNWVKGHAGDPGNEKADELANKGADSVS